MKETATGIWYTIRDVLETLPVCKKTWILGVKRGLFPIPIKLGGRSYWKEDEIISLLNTNEKNENEKIKKIKVMKDEIHTYKCIKSIRELSVGDDVLFHGIKATFIGLEGKTAKIQYRNGSIQGVIRYKLLRKKQYKINFEYKGIDTKQKQIYDNLIYFKNKKHNIKEIMARL